MKKAIGTPVAPQMMCIYDLISSFNDIFAVKSSDNLNIKI